MGEINQEVVEDVKSSKLKIVAIVASVIISIITVSIIICGVYLVQFTEPIFEGISVMDYNLQGNGIRVSEYNTIINKKVLPKEYFARGNKSDLLLKSKNNLDAKIRVKIDDEMNKYLEEKVISDEVAPIIYMDYNVDLNKPKLKEMLNHSFNVDNYIKVNVNVHDDLTELKYSGRLNKEVKDGRVFYKVSDSLLISDKHIKDIDKYVELVIVYNSIDVKDGVIGDYIVREVKNI